MHLFFLKKGYRYWGRSCPRPCRRYICSFFFLQVSLVSLGGMILCTILKARNPRILISVFPFPILSQSTKPTYPFSVFPYIPIFLSQHENPRILFPCSHIFLFFSLSTKPTYPFFRVQSIQTLPLTTVNVRSGVSAVLVVLERSSSAALGARTVFVVPVSL